MFFQVLYSQHPKIIRQLGVEQENPTPWLKTKTMTTTTEALFTLSSVKVRARASPSDTVYVNVNERIGLQVHNAMHVQYAIRSMSSESLVGCGLRSQSLKYNRVFRWLPGCNNNTYYYLHMLLSNGIFCADVLQSNL